MTSKLHTTYRLAVETLSPLHIASGTGALIRDYDYVVEGNQAVVVDVERLLAGLSDARLEAAAADPRLTRLIPAGGASRYASYNLRLTSGQPQQITEHIKDPFLRVYIPGSSLKGALRTALAWATYNGPLRLGGRQKSADDPIEQQLFGYDLHNTHRDLFRALRVGDAHARGNVNLHVVPVSVFSLRGHPLCLQRRAGFALHVEAIPKGTALEGGLTLDEHALSLHSGGPDAGLHERRSVLDNLAQHCRASSENLVDAEADFYSRYGDRVLRDFYHALKQKQASLKPNEFLLCLGWGTGWRAKTLGTKLTPEDVERIADTYRLVRWRSGLFPQVFPKSRRLIGTDQPQMPLGWVRVALQPATAG